MTVQVGINTGVISGDVGGTGITRQKFIRSDHGTILVADANAAIAAWRAVWQAVHSEMPNTVSVQWEATCEVIDDNTAAVDGTVPISSVPATVFGSSTSHYAAGNGIRVNWTTSNVLNRRLIRGATFLVPLTVDAFLATGQVSSVISAGYVTALSTYLTAMGTANLIPVVHHRPKKGTFVGGVAAGITGFNIGPTGAMLKSRRT